MNPVRPIWFYTYVLKSRKNNTFYTGVTTNLKKRLDEHNKGLVISTKHRRPLQLIYYEACLDKDDAFRREKYLKTGMGKRYLKNRLKGILKEAI
jgi:putative endonuclease